MLIYLRPNQSAAGRMRASTSVMSPLLASVERGEPLESCVQSAVEAFGFTSFVFGMTTAQRPDKDSQFYFCTSAPSQWAAEYDAKSYIEIDPRIAHCWIRLVPLIWDAQIADGNPKVERFLERGSWSVSGRGFSEWKRNGSHRTRRTPRGF